MPWCPYHILLLLRIERLLDYQNLGHKFPQQTQNNRTKPLVCVLCPNLLRAALTTQSRHNSRRSQSVRLVRWSFEGFEENPTSVYLYKGGYLSLFVLKVCSESELRKLVCVKIWNGMNLTSMQIFRLVILITGYVTLKLQ